MGGNALIQAGEQGSALQTAKHLRRTAAAIVRLLRDGMRVVVTHGNGPQVGAALLRSEIAAGRAYTQSLDICDACTQGEIGYELAQALGNELQYAGLPMRVVSLVTQVLVLSDDPAFENPTKPIGMFYSAEEAQQKTETFGWRMVKDRKHGYRRVVPSPDPVTILELETIRELVKGGTLVIAAGGGGIPVARTAEGLLGVEAVIDKDLASSLLAAQLGVDLLLITTDVECVCTDFGTQMQKPIHQATAEQMEELLAKGQFPPGSMGPKIQAAVRFLRAGGKRAVITDCEHLQDAVKGSAGTQILPDGCTRENPSEREKQLAASR